MYPFDPSAVDSSQFAPAMVFQTAKSTENNQTESSTEQITDKTNNNTEQP